MKSVIKGKSKQMSEPEPGAEREPEPERKKEFLLHNTATTRGDGIRYFSNTVYTPLSLHNTLREEDQSTRTRMYKYACCLFSHLPKTHLAGQYVLRKGGNGTCIGRSCWRSRCAWERPPLWAAGSAGREDSRWEHNSCRSTQFYSGQSYNNTGK
jgi:hypothetical protein